jgi:zona occludens toxin (predicted ATPase)
MITLITGTPGSGKTLRAVSLIKDFLAGGRPVYANIAGINIPGVLPAPDDWRDTPESSVVIYDEVQQKWPSTGKPGAAPDDDIKALEIHRHSGHDIIVMTQHPTLVHHHVRKLVGQHIHVRRASNAKVVTLFTMPEVFDPKDKNEIRNADKQTWRYPKDLFACYKSATAHTHTFKMPAKIKYMGIFILLLMVGVSYALYTSDFFALASSSTAAQGEAEGQSEAAPPLGRHTQLDSLKVLGCMVIDTYCRCWSDVDGSPLMLDFDQCLLVSREFPKG